MSAQERVRIGFVGAGKMATALARGLIASGFASARDVVASDVVKEARKRFEQETGARTVETNEEVLAQAEVVVLAVKPQQLSYVLAELRPLVTAEHLVVSIAAGVPLAALASVLGEDKRLVRVMPNTPCLVGACAAGFAVGGAATEEDAALVRRLLETVGVAFELPEKLLDAVTGLSGSGPAYVYVFIEALADGGVRMGLPRDVAVRLAAQTVLGAAKMVLETGQHPASLKDAVASPGGTTIAGLHELELGAFRGCVLNAVQAATERSVELAQLS